MNDIEKEIEKDFEEEVLEEGERDDEVIKKNFNYYRDDDKKKRIIIIVVGVLLVLVSVGLIIYLAVGKKENKDLEVDNKNDSSVEEIKKEEDFGKRKGYVSCDDNTSPLNVRSSVGGDIIDMLSCFKEVEIDEELEETDNCKKWYKISYDKNNKEHTGYACGSYIKDNEVSKEKITLVRNLVDKVNAFYEESRVMPYCGKTGLAKEIYFADEEETGKYLKSEFKGIDELKKSVLTYMDEGLIDVKLELADYSNPKYYDDYYEIDGDLYCRRYSGKGWLTYYTGNYDLEITSVSENKIVGNIAYQYLKEDSKCDINKLDSCSNGNFNYELGKFTVEKKNDNYVVTKINFHK